MPVNDHLAPIEIRDFSPGLWERADWLMPANAAQVMTDCHPQIPGGLRAWFKPTSISNSGITAPTKERVIGLYARLVSDDVDRFLMTQWSDPAASSGNKRKPRLYRMNESASETTWTQVYKTSGTTEFATSDNDAPSKVSFRTYVLSDGTVRVVFVLRNVHSDAGLYRLNVADSSSSIKAIKLTTTSAGEANPIGALAIHQQRIIVTSGDRIMWSDPGAENFDADNFLRVDPNVGAPIIRVIDGIEPSDLLGLRQGPGPFLVQGDITSPTVQEMGEGMRLGSYADFGHHPDGKLIIASDGYLYLTDGRNFENIGTQLAAKSASADASSLGDAVYLNEYVFQAGGKVFDTRTKSWFKQSGLAGNFLNVALSPGAVWGTVETGGESFTLAQVAPKNENSRCSTYTWKSAPLRDPSGRQIEIREVEIVANNYQANSTFAITVNGTTVTKTMSSTGRQNVSALFKQRAEVLDVQVVSTAGSTGEAPSIEAIRIFTRAGHHKH